MLKNPVKMMLATIVLSFYSLLYSASVNEKKVGVIPFENQTEKSGFQFLSSSFAEAASKELSEVSGIILVERLQFKKVLKEIEISQTGILEDEAILDEARLKNADYLFIGAYSGNATKMRVFLRFINVKTGKVEVAGSIEGTIDEIFSQMGKIRSLANRLVSSDSISVNILVNPDEAEIYIDSLSAGKSPLTGYSLLPGEHDILIVKKGFRNYTGKIKVKEKGQNFQFSLDPVSNNRYFVQAGIYYWYSFNDMKGDQIAYALKGGARWHDFFIFASFETNLNVEEEYDYRIPYKTLKEIRKYNFYSGFVGFTYPFVITEVISPYVGFSLGYSNWMEKEPNSVLHGYENMDYDIFAVRPIFGISFFHRSPFQIFLEGAYFYGINKVKMEKVKTIDFFGNKEIDENKIHLSAFTIGGGVRYAF